jgi:hypothetical protein
MNSGNIFGIESKELYEMATTSKEGSRNANYPLLTQRA